MGVHREEQGRAEKEYMCTELWVERELAGDERGRKGRGRGAEAYHEEGEQAKAGRWVDVRLYDSSK